MQFDVAYEPIVVGKTLFIASAQNDALTAFDTDTGAERWRFYADGPMRFAPTVWRGKVYAVSDDGHLYCLDAAKGTLLWKFRGVPDKRLVLGNGRLISMWPARGAAVVADGRVYFAAGIWPSSGIALHALDAATGKVIWTNDGSGSIFISHPHGSPAFGGVSPQGYLAVQGDSLFVPGGRSVPACYDRTTGKLRYYHLAAGGKSGEYRVALDERFYYCAGKMHRLGDGMQMKSLKGDQSIASLPVLADGLAFDGGRRRFAALDMAGAEIKVAEDKKTKRKKTKRKRIKRKTTRVTIKSRWSLRGAGEVALKAGGRIYTIQGKRIVAFDLPKQADAMPTKSSWSRDFPATPRNVIAADGKLFVGTTDGTVYCFGGKKIEPREWKLKATGMPAHPTGPSFGKVSGYAIINNSVDPGTLLAENPELHVVIVHKHIDLDPFRREWDAAGLLGARVSVVRGDITALPLPSYLASLVVLPAQSRLWTGDEIKAVYRTLRPYGGRVVGIHKATVAALKLPGAKTEGEVLTRTGPLPGAGSWTHQNGDAANSVNSRDGIVRAPLGPLWFGGPPNTEVLPRHGHGPTPQVVGGRLFIMGADMLRAVDVYTGRLMWQVKLPGVGKHFDNTAHQPGANSLGANFATTTDAVYVLRDAICLRLDPATGKKVSEFRVGDAHWSHLVVSGEYLVAGLSPRTFVRDVFEETDFFKRAQVSDKEAVKIAKIIRGKCLNKLKNVALSPLDRQKENLDAVLVDLNRITGLKDMRKIIPADTLKRLGKQPLKDLEAHLADPKRDDSKLPALNRALLAACFKVLPMDRWSRIGSFGWDHTASARIAVLNRHTGKLLWQRDAVQSFTHNTIIVGGGKVFCIDATPARVRATLARRGKPVPPATLLALDIRTGNPAWSDDENVFGTWLAWSARHNVLVEAGRPSRDMVAFEENARMAVRHAADGKRIWPAVGAKTKSYGGPVILHGDRIITEGAAIELMTGKPIIRKNPLTGADMPWCWKKHYGCGTAVSSEHLLTFRSAAAGFYDLAGDGGTGNLSGFKSSCTSNLIPADGVLNAPDYTRTCSCSYQNQTSLAFIHTPDVETWAFGIVPRVGAEQTITRLGINLGAPGQHVGPDGTLWVNDDGPHSSPSPVKITIKPADAPRFRRHSMALQGEMMPMVAASGVEGIRKLTVRLAPDGQKLRPYTVRLYFREPRRAKPGERVFSVTMQGKEVLGDLDLPPHQLYVKEVKGVTDCHTLTIELTPKRGVPILCGVQVIMQP